eukprot:5148603-Prorocentrum_lima.AAC.1
MTSSLVGSEMCIRDRFGAEAYSEHWKPIQEFLQLLPNVAGQIHLGDVVLCLLYTSDAADDM